MLAERVALALGRRALKTEWEGFEPSRRVNLAHAISSRAPSAARTPLPADPSIARRFCSIARWTFFSLRALFRSATACAPYAGSPSFRLAPSVSRSRLKLCKGTDAFRGNGTQAEWTKRQAFGHFFFRERGRPDARRSRMAAAFALFPLRAVFRVSGRLRFKGSHPYCPSRTGR